MRREDRSEKEDTDSTHAHTTHARRTAGQRRHTSRAVLRLCSRCDSFGVLVLHFFFGRDRSKWAAINRWHKWCDFSPILSLATRCAGPCRLSLNVQKPLPWSKQRELMMGKVDLLLTSANARPPRWNFVPPTLRASLTFTSCSCA